MLAAKRHEEIMRILTEEGCADAAQLSEFFGVSAKTLRKDFDKLETMGLLERVHGGAVLKNNGSNIFPIAERKRQNLDDKKEIGTAALQFIEEGDTFILDGGTTTLELAKLLGDKRVTVLTNDLRIATELLYKENVTLLVTGGRLRREGAYTLLGRDAERYLDKYQVKKVFLGTSALDFRCGLTVFSLDEAEIKRAMIKSAREVICLADYSKFHKVALVSFCPLEKVGMLITDKRISLDDWSYLEAKGIKVHPGDKPEDPSGIEERMRNDD